MDYIKSFNKIHLCCFLLILIFAFGCSSSQEKSSADVQSDVPAMDVAGTYNIHNIITESTCVEEGTAEKEEMETKTTISQNGSILNWSDFVIGSKAYPKQESNIKSNIAEFSNVRVLYLNNSIKWNATIDFSEVGFSGTGDFYFGGTSRCGGKFSITGSRID